VYLFGAGATHACAAAEGAGTGLLTRDLNRPIADAVRDLFECDPYRGDAYLSQLVTEAVSENTDYEQLITFLDQSFSPRHKRLATDLRSIFERVLRAQLKLVEDELGHAPLTLYRSLLDMYNVRALPETLGGIITLNYDDYLERAVTEVFAAPPSTGLTTKDRGNHSELSVLKLHGSFDWGDTFPIERGVSTYCGWIPPGIVKGKSYYPFNLLWGRAREILDCDVLRVVGCRLGGSDWDLISLLFSSMYTRDGVAPFDIEVIDSPRQGSELARAYPYLNIRSMFDVEPIGSLLVAELFGHQAQLLRDLDHATRNSVLNEEWRHNWFAEWLRQVRRTAEESLSDLGTQANFFAALPVGA
jgi:hypothetical protein